MEPPECPVCLQIYDGACTVPRVLSCGHTACETCLTRLPQPYPNTIRCPACTQLAKFPAQGPSGLPKNIDLLRLGNPIPNPNPISRNPPKQPTHDHDHPFLQQFWSAELYAAWNDWILPKDGFLIEPMFGEGQGVDADLGLCSVLMGKESCVGEGKRVSLLRVGNLPCEEGSVVAYSYVVGVMKCLSGMRDEERRELGLVLSASKRVCGVCRVYGLWGDYSGDGFLYLVCERQCRSVLESMGGFRNGFMSGNGGVLGEGVLAGFSVMGMEMCEAVIALHSEGLVMGCVGLSYFFVDEFGHVRVDLNEVLASGRKARGFVAGAASDGRVGDREVEALMMNLTASDLLVSPELLCELLRIAGVGIESSQYDHRVERKSDVWPLAFVLLWLLVGEQFSKDLADTRDTLLDSNEENCVGQNMDWVEKIGSLLETRLGEEYLPLQQTLCKCLNSDPQSRPPLSDVWDCVRGLIIRPPFDILFRLDGNVSKNDEVHFLALGELCQLPEEIFGTHRQEVKENDDGVELDHFCEEKVDKNIVNGVTQGTVKFKNMEGHLDCVTGLAIGGSFLFSSSFDKTIRVWSLQDFSLVHTFRGHEHKVTAIVYVDEELPLCISGDSGGGIFIWSISSSLGQEPLQKWYEEKDWRYSGIYALAVPGNKHLYTGSGDKSIKAWSLLDCTLICTLNGHKSVVSALAACNGVLYSGSYDGTIRLWCLSDHSPLTILGDDVTENTVSVLSLKAYDDMLVAAHENGCVKIWKSDVLVKSVKMHDGATFAAGMEGKCLFTGGWDKTINVQELSVDGFQMDVRKIGSIVCDSVVTSLLCWQGKLFAGCANRVIKVFYHGSDKNHTSHKI